MGRNRYFRSEFFRNDALGHMPPHARLLFAGLITIADREGRVEDRPGRIKVDLFPYDTDLGEPEVDKYVDLLHAHDLIVRYTVENVRVIQIVKWAKYQRPHPREAPSELPANPDQIKEANLKLTKGKPRLAKGEPKCPSPSLSLKDRERDKTVNPRSVSSLRSDSRVRENVAAETETTSAAVRKIFASKGLRLTAATATNLDAAIDAGVTAASVDHALDVAIARHAGSPGAYAVTTALDWLRNGNEPPLEANGHDHAHGRSRGDELDSIAKDRKRVSAGLTGSHRQPGSDANVIDVPMQEVSDDTRHS